MPSVSAPPLPSVSEPVAPAPPAAEKDAPRAERRPTLAHRLEYAALRGAIGGLGALPWDRATAVGAWLGRLGYAPTGIRRGVTERQIAAAFPEFSAARVREVARASYESLGRTTLEAALVPRLGHAGILGLYERVEGWELLEEARAAGRGALLVTGHLGNWELGNFLLGLLGVRSSAIARRLDNPHLHRFVKRFRVRTGQTILDKHADYERIQAVLAEGGTLGVLADQDAGARGPFVPFFGRPASTTKAVALLALEHRAPILVLGVQKVAEPFRYRLTVEDTIHPEEYDAHPDAVVAITARFTAALERMIRRYPEQYFWLHRRWKHQPKARPARRAA